VGCKPAPETDNQTKSDSLVLKGSVAGWKETSATINVMGYFVNPEFHGTIDSNGSLEIQLPEDFKNLTVAAFAKADSSETSGYELAIPTAQETFANTDTVNFEGAEVGLALAGKYYGFEAFQNGQYVTTIYPASSMEFMDHVISPGSNKATLGWYYYFIYSEKPVRIKGTNTTMDLFSNESDESFESSTTYKVQIQPGWNVVKYEVTALASSADAKYNANSRVTITTVAELPNALPWVFIASQINPY
jgi:hypothetical protein